MKKNVILLIFSTVLVLLGIGVLSYNSIIPECDGSTTLRDINELVENSILKVIENNSCSGEISTTRFSGFVYAAVLIIIGIIGVVYSIIWITRDTIGGIVISSNIEL